MPGGYGWYIIILLCEVWYNATSGAVRGWYSVTSGTVRRVVQRMAKDYSGGVQGEGWGSARGSTVRGVVQSEGWYSA